MKFLVIDDNSNGGELIIRDLLKEFPDVKFEQIIRWHDITEKHKMEAALQESEQKYHTLAENSPVGIVIVQDERIVYANPVFVKRTGRSSEELAKTFPLDLFHPDDREKVAKHHRDRIAGKEAPKSYEVRFLTPEEERWAELYAALITYQGKPAALVIILDITERKQAEEKMRKTEQEKSIILDALSEHVVYQDTKMRVLWANRAACELTGSVPEQLVGRYCYEIWHHRSEPCIGCPVEKALKTGQPQQAEMNFPDGGVLFIRGYPVTDANSDVLGVVEVTLDITERKRAAEVLLESERRFRSLFESNPIGISIHIPDRRQIRCNQAFHEMLGYSEEELASIDCTHPDDLQEGEKFFQELILGKRDIYQREKRYIRKDGRIMWAQLTASAVRDSNGKLEYIIMMVEDITERKQVEAQIAYQANLLANVNDAVIGSDPRFVLTFWNRGAEAIFGWKSEEVLGRPGSELLRSEFIGVERNEILRILNETGQAHGEAIQYHKDGTPVYIEFNTIALRDETGQVTGYVSVNHDITERKWTEEALERSERLYRGAIEAAGAVPYYRNYKTNTYEFVGDRIQALTGYSAEEFTPDVWESIIREVVLFGDLAGLSVEEAERRVRSTEGLSSRADCRIRMRGGEERWLADASVHVRDERGISVGSLGILQDVTDRKRAEEVLRESEQRYRTLFENTRDSVIIVGPDGRILSANSASASMLGYESPEDLVGIHADKLYLNTEDRKVVLAELIKKGYIENYEIKFVKKDGTPVYVIATSVVRRDEKGNIVRLEGIFKDITERKQMEEDLKESNRRLEETLAELKATQQQIIQQERLRALGQMASGVAHDFNNALTPILGYSEILLDVPELLDDKEKMKHYLKQMNTVAEDAKSIVSRLREFYRHREEEEIFVPVNLNQLVKQAIELTQPKWKDQALSKGITISMKTDLQEIPIISGNESELRGVLINLIINSVDAMKENGTIALRTRHKGKHVVLEVSDTGIGMTEEVKQRCFEPFFTTKSDSGTGLGLSIVYGIIQRHEGTIEVDSEPGKGTTFII